MNYLTYIKIIAILKRKINKFKFCIYYDYYIIKLKNS